MLITRDGITITVPDGSTDEFVDTMFEAAGAVHQAATMSSGAINDLPDSAFAHIEAGGTKDSGGKTVPRSKRHFPIHDAAHVRAALSRIGQGAEFSAQAKPKVEAAAKKLGIGAPAQAAAEPEPEPETVTQDDSGVTIELPDGTSIRVSAAADPHQAASPLTPSLSDVTMPGDGDVQSTLDDHEERIQSLEGALGDVMSMLEGKVASTAEQLANGD